MHEEERITLDKGTFKALASDTRIGILKSLGIRRKTLSELAREHRMSVSTIKEHLDNLSGVGLVEQKNEGHKWKYYELTRRGRGVLNPEEKKIWVLLSISALALLGTGIDMATGLFSRALLSGVTFGTDSIMRGAEPVLGTPAAAETAGQIAATPAIPWIHIAFLLVFAALSGLFVFKLLRNRKNIGF
jgi:DNA-binding transcriptional ArsR family regulator